MSMKEIKIHTVAACCNNWGIGNKGNLPWNLPKEYKHFSKLTTGNPPEGKQNVVVMGRKTWQSIPAKFRPLKNRINIVMSTSLKAPFEGPHALVHSFKDLLSLLQSDEWKDKIHDVFNIGGQSIYEVAQSSPYCGNIYLTRIFGDFECDTFFPKLGNEFCQVADEQLDEQYPHLPRGIQEDKGTKWKVEIYYKTNNK
ncbi:dihydrofolate reductase-like [Clavelina lepadiformis]|uniref:Dihydrofolate reductase n=1 Tax=Clavelina lepadiformis TaxID=159417 RepID=A0ABP0EZ05_CLALP